MFQISAILIAHPDSFLGSMMVRVFGTLFLHIYGNHCKSLNFVFTFSIARVYYKASRYCHPCNRELQPVQNQAALQ